MSDTGNRLTNLSGQPSVPLAVHDPNAVPLAVGDTTALTVDEERRLRVAVEDGANSENQETIIEELSATNLHVDDLETLISTTNAKLSGGLPTTLGSNDGLKVEFASQSASAFVPTRLTLDGSTFPNAIPISLPSTTTSTPALDVEGLPTREVPEYVGGKEIHAQTSVGIANASNKLLFGFTNNTGDDLYVNRVNASNTQTTVILGVVGQMNLRISNAAISGGTTIDANSTPALLASCRDPRIQVPTTIVWNTGGTLGGTIQLIDSFRWSTDEVQPNGSGLACDIAANSVFADPLSFEDNPVIVPNGWSCALVCDAALTNGTTIVDFNIRRK